MITQPSQLIYMKTQCAANSIVFPRVIHGGDKFREYKKVYVKENSLKIEALKHYGVRG